YDQRNEKSKCRRNLDEARIEAALAIGRALTDVHGRSSVLTAQRKSLQYANCNQRDGCKPSGRLVRWQEANQRGRKSHHRQRDQKCVLPSNQIAYAPKENRAERPHQKTDGECCKVCDVRERVVARRVEFQ